MNFYSNLKSILILVFLTIGMMIFAAMILMKVDVMSQKAKADLKLFSANSDWEGFVAQQSAHHNAIGQTE